MPPSPALRYSPGRDSRAENHKRGRSLEGALLFKEKDDDLALFNEMQSRERENFLLQSSDDLEDTFSTKLRHFSDLKLGISIPVRGESSELLNMDGNKNDYDWLLTPPDTPLFPSLDDEPPPVNVSSRGRPRSQPITITRSSTMEKSHRSSRGSASPNRLSPSPRSGNSSLQSRGRPSSTPHSSPTPSQWTATPSCRLSPPPSKPSTSAPRSSTPTPRRASTWSGARGISPVRTTRGNSASPKIKAWQSNIPGFSSEAPPNLRTSLADRPATYVRGSSPASRNGRESTLKFGRQSMSPTASRSVSSSHSQERDWVSSQSRGFVASSGDDDVDSLQSIHVGSLDRLASKRTSSISNNRALAFSKKSTRISLPGSAPKRSFNSALRQMDHRKSPQNMFRPLLSSVPSSTFFVGKSNSIQRPLISRNSTTGSNASSDQGTGVALDTEGSDHHQEDMSIEKTTYLDAQEEVFAFDKAEVLNKDGELDREDSLVHRQGNDFDRNPVTECEPNDSEEFGHQEIDVEISSASDTVRADFSEANSLENTLVCSKCGCRYQAIESVEKDVNLCPDCRRQDNQSPAINTTLAIENSPMLPLRASDEHEPFDEAQLVKAESQSRFLDEVEARIAQGDDVTGQPDGSHARSDSDSGVQKLLNSNDHQGLKLDISEGAGISVLLKRSSSGKGPVVQSRNFVASTVPYDDYSYIRDSPNNLRSSIGHGSTSASSSIDFVSARKVETRVERQLSGKKSDMENYRYDINARPQSAGSSLSGTSNQHYHALGLETNTCEENTEAFVGDMQHDGIQRATVTSHVKAVGSENNESLIDVLGLVEDLCEQNGSNRTMDATTVGIQLEENSVASLPNSEHLLSRENADDFSNSTGSGPNAEVSIVPPDSSARVNDIGVPTHSSLASISEIETEEICQTTPGSENDDISSDSRSTSDGFQDPSVSNASDKDMCASVLDRNNSDHLHGILEDSTVTVQEGSKSRSLTLEEATDTILFCSSIVHDLAYQAATIAIEKEASVPLEGSCPTVTILGKSSAANIRDSHNRTTGKRTSKSSHRVKQKRMEPDAKSPPRETENDENANESMVRNVGLPNNMDSTKPPKLESKCNCTIM